MNNEKIVCEIWCPKCGGGECYDCCDNDCGTNLCDCGADFYIDSTGEYILNHNPECGYETCDSD